MIKSIRFRNFGALREATLPLSRCTLIVGPNGSGKSTALKALQALRAPKQLDRRQILTVGSLEDACPEIRLEWGGAYEGSASTFIWKRNGSVHVSHEPPTAKEPDVTGIRVFSLDARAIAEPVQLEPNIELGENGTGLAAVLDDMRDHHPERFDGFNRELHNWFPEFDCILFNVPCGGAKQFSLRARTRKGHFEISAPSLSQGTLIGLAMLTVAYLPDPPSIVGFEEPDRSIHPRLLEQVRDALYRLSYPENFGEDRPAVQVIATTHSPYFLDLFREHPEEVVIAAKDGLNATFQRLSERPDIQKILGDAPLGEVWYSGVLGGVPSEP